MFKRYFSFFLIPFPSIFKVFVYRYFYRFKIGKNVKIGLSFFNPSMCEIGDRVKIGHFNFISKMKQLKCGNDVIIGHLNIILGGDLVDIGDGSHIVRSNEINSIINPLATGSPTPELILGERVIITVKHKIDFTDKVTFGSSVVFAGRNSNIWTHNRQMVGPVSIGRNCYVGSGIQMVANTSVGAYCVVGLGSIITKKLTKTHQLIGGIPAKEIADLSKDSYALTEFPTRPDLG